MVIPSWINGHMLHALELQISGYLRLARDNSVPFALRLAWFNLIGIRRVMTARIHGFDVTLRSGTPDFTVAIESLGVELETVTGRYAPDAASLVIDAGGYIGTAAIKLARAYPACQIVCIEPASENLEILRLNVAPFPNIIVRQAALAAIECDVVLHDPGRHQWGFTIVPGASAGALMLETVRAVTIERIMAEHGCDRLFLLKLDIEGAEVDLLAAAAGWMSRTDVLIIELHERLVRGASAAFHAATNGRLNTALPGEKFLSVLSAPG